MKRRLGRLESLLLAYTQLRGLRTVRTGELRDALSLSAAQERSLLSRLARAKLLARARRGLYLVPPRLPLGGSWSPNPVLALSTLMQDRGARYQICGPSAFNRYGFDDQVPTRLYAYNNRLTGERTVGSAALTLIKVADRRLGDTERVTAGDGQVAVYASRVRTLVDAVYDWSRFDSLPRAYEWIRGDVRAKRVDAEALVRATLRYGDTGTIRRMAALAQREDFDEALLRRLERVLKPTTALIPWIPARPKRGTVDRRWGVVLNDAD